MSQHAIAHPYATAVFEMAEEQSLLDTLAADMEALRKLIASSPEFVEFTTNPLVTREARDSILTALFSGKLNELTLRFVRFISAKNRLEIVGDILDELHAMILDHRGILEGQVISASALSDAQIDSIREKLKTRFHKEIQMAVSVDETLIGGFQVHIGDSVHDYSIRNQLDNLKQNIIHA